jgi:polysaccharide biosynthesis transport protein
MNISQFLLVLRARFRIVMLILLATVMATLVVSLIMPKTYEATATLVLNMKGSDPVTGLTLPAQLMPGYIATQMDIISSMNVALQVVDELKLADNPEMQERFKAASKETGSIRDWLATQLLEKLVIKPAHESSVLNISFRNSNPQLAANIANAFASAYQRTSVQLKVNPSKEAAAYFNKQIKLLRDNFETAQKKVSKYQQENGIVNADNRFDVESTRLNELSSQLVMVQGQMMEATSRQTQALGNGATESPDIIANPLIQNLKSQLAVAQLKLSGLAQKLTTNHPNYQSAEAEVNQLRSELNGQIRATSNSLGNNVSILKRREFELRAALDVQRAKVLEINRKRDELKLLTNDLDSAQRQYDSATQRFTQTNFEGQSSQTDVVLLNPANAPITAATPKTLINTLLSIVIGTILGLGGAIISEIRDRRVRSPIDLVQGLKAPVLGVLVWGGHKRLSPEMSTPLLSNHRSLSN